LRCIQVQKWLWCIEISKIDLTFYTYETMCPIVNHEWTFFTKTIYFFVAILWTNICFHIIFNFLTKIWYYCYYYVVIWRKKVWIVPRRQINFSSISRKCTIMGHMSLVVIFCNFSYLIRCTCSSIWNWFQ
jgi:hypothetical protein